MNEDKRFIIDIDETALKAIRQETELYGETKKNLDLFLKTLTKLVEIFDEVPAPILSMSIETKPEILIEFVGSRNTFYVSTKKKG